MDETENWIRWNESFSINIIKNKKKNKKDKIITTEKIGKVVIEPKLNCKILLKDVVYGGFNSNIISVRKLIEDGYKIIFEQNVAYITKNEISFKAKANENNLWIINDDQMKFEGFKTSRYFSDENSQSFTSRNSMNSNNADDTEIKWCTR